MGISRSLPLVLLGTACLACGAQGSAALSPISLDEFFNTTSIASSRLSPDGSAAVIATASPDWKNNTFQHNLWLWTAASGLKPLTHSGSEDNPQWSPDGKWIAFVSDRALPGEESGADGAAKNGARASRIWLIPATGGEALPLYAQKLDTHSFDWSPDSAAIFFSVTEPLTPEQDEAQKQEWKDVVRWREQHRGDLMLKIPVALAIESALKVTAPSPAKDTPEAEKKKPVLPDGASVVARSVYGIGEIAVSEDGQKVAFETQPVHHRMESADNYDIYVVGANGGEVHRLTHNQALESALRWSRDGKYIYFQVNAGGGSLEGPYRDIQGRLYRLNSSGGEPERLGSDFTGSFSEFELLPDGRQLALGLLGTEQQVYLVDGARATKLPGRAGSYAGLSASRTGRALLIRYSNIGEPTQVYRAADAAHPDQLTALTALNPVFKERARPEWQTYSWKADDGRTVEGVLIYPPGKRNDKHLRMLTFIHGGPADADGNRFEADWYDWAALAAANGWLVFRPNYRGSSGYGDDFMLEIQPHLVSRPGRDILEGVDALVKDGIADPDHLAIGGYSYGGYMTNWLLTQTTRFKAAVTGAGAVEHAANWGNDDLTGDDAWYLGGRPWENPSLYESEAALFRFDKVKTPTHLVQGDADVRVSYLEGVTMERALDTLGIPHRFLVFPGEGHGLDKNPWHGYIKVREELKWLEQYGR